MILIRALAFSLFVPVCVLVGFGFGEIIFAHDDRLQVPWASTTEVYDGGEYVEGVLLSMDRLQEMNWTRKNHERRIEYLENELFQLGLRLGKLEGETQ